MSAADGYRWDGESARSLGALLGVPEVVLLESTPSTLDVAHERAARGAPVRLKWPNDLQVDDRKLAGILVEARWRDGALDWLAVGMGVNVRVPDRVPDAAGLPHAMSRVEPLAALVPALREAARRTGPLSEGELAEYATRDVAAGRRCVEPMVGTVQGIAPGGELLVSTGSEVALARAGSLRFAGEDG